MNNARMEEMATIAQIEYATVIAEELGIDLPEENTKKAYIDFISNNVDEYKSCVVPLIRWENNWNSLNKHYEFCEDTFQYLRTLHNHAGVYYFFDNYELVYVGKSKSLGERVMTSLLERANRFTNIDSIAIYETETMADAHILEPILITTYKPKLNREFKEDDYPTIIYDELLKEIGARACDVEKMRAFIYKEREDM